MDAAPVLLPSSSAVACFSDSERPASNNTSARNSTHGSDGIFDRQALRSPINGSESEYEDEDDLISEMPNDSHAASCYGEETQDEEHSFTQYTPSRKTRSPFRNPSSVRGMQLDTTPPHLRSPTRDSLGRHRMSIGSRHSTPRSVRSYRSGSPTKIKMPMPKKEQPLVLLHVTILPISCPYSQALLETTAPPHILQNWKLLREKVPDTVLERGILLPHPREEYELLEERLLESLELTAPRILKCGHYHRAITDGEESEAEDSVELHQCINDDNDSDADSDICEDCTRHVRDGSRGSNGTGKRRWNIRIYAANGLMRSGAWTAAWKEMERVDVEISPWIEDSLRRELDLKRAEEEKEHARVAAEERERANEVAHTSSRPTGMDEERLREIYGDSQPLHPPITRDFTPGDIVEAYENSPVYDDLQDYLEPVRANPLHAESPSPSPQQGSGLKISKRHTGIQYTQELPLGQLVVNYIKVLLEDRRNVALVFTSVIAVWLALRSDTEAGIKSGHGITPAVKAPSSEGETGILTKSGSPLTSSISIVNASPLPSGEDTFSTATNLLSTTIATGTAVDEALSKETVVQDPPITFDVEDIIEG